jgi:protein O-mannosyl-transferase
VTGVVSRLRRSPLLSGAILIAAFLAYSRSLGNGFVSDDVDLIVNNRYISQWSFVWRSFAHDLFWGSGWQTSMYRPLTNIWFAIHWHLGAAPGVWHATQIGLHLISVWLVFRIALRLTGDHPTAMLAAALFALTPLGSEAVAWISAAAIPLSTTFELAAFYLFIGRADPRRLSLSALFFYAAGLLSYDGAAAFPGIIAAHVLLLESRGDSAEANSGAAARIHDVLVRTAPFVAEVLVYLAVRRVVLGSVIGAPAAAAQIRDPLVITTATGILLTLPRVLTSYAGLVAMPWATTLADVVPVTSAAAPQFYLPLLGIAVAAVTLFLVVLAHPRRNFHLFCIAWTGVALLPMTNLRALHPDFLVCRRYLYLPSVGWFLLVADWTAAIARRSTAARLLVSCGAAALLVVYGISLWNAQRFWHDDYTAYNGFVQEYPRSPFSHASLGSAMMKRGDLSGAQRELDQALSLDPRSRADWHANTLYALGQVDARLGHLEQGTNEIAEALHELENLPATRSTIPARAYSFLAELYDREGQPEKSRATLDYAQSLPDGAEAAGVALAQIEWRHGDLAGAEATLRDLTRSQPNDPGVWVLLGRATEREGRPQEALSAYERALALAPYDPQIRALAGQARHALGPNQ